MPLTPLAARYDQFILDLDGCVWVGGEPTPGVVEALEELRAAGKQFAFATNNAFESGEDLVAQLWKIGVRASLRRRRDGRRRHAAPCSPSSAPGARPS